MKINVFRVSNFLSIEDEINIEFKNGKGILLYGPNDVGKSNIITAFFILKMCCQKDNIPEIDFSYEQDGEVSSFEIEFEDKGIQYYYKLVLQKGEIFYELFERNGEKIFERQRQKIHVNDNFKEEYKKGEGKINKNSTVMAVLSRWNGKIDGKPVNFWADKLHFFTEKIDETYFNNKKKKNLLEILKASDFKNIKDIRIHVYSLKRKYEIELIKQDGSSEKLEDQSKNFKKFFYLIWHTLDAIEEKKILFIDDFGEGLHTLLAEKILKFINKGNQFFITTHNIDLLDLYPFELKKEQIAFLEKNKEERVDFYKLDDFEGITDKTNVKKLYKHGAFGAIPNVVDFYIEK